MKINGLPVVDTDQKLPLQITKRDCSIGSLKEPSSCAAARAICRQPGIKEARVHISRVYVQIGKRWIRYMTPDSLRSEIIAFDRGGKFQPGEYTLLPIQPVARFDAKKKKRVPENRDGSRPQKRLKAHVVKGIRSHGGTERKAAG